MWKAHDGISQVEAIKALGISDDLVEVEENVDSDSEPDDGELFLYSQRIKPISELNPFADSNGNDSDTEGASEEDVPTVRNPFALLNENDDD